MANTLPKGWAGLYASLIRDLHVIAPNLRVLDHEVSFGTIQIYFNANELTGREIELSNARIGRAEEISNSTCMVCSESANMVHRDMSVKVLCEKHTPDGWKNI